MRRRTLITLGSILSAFALGLSACGGDDNDNDNAGAPDDAAVTVEMDEQNDSGQSGSATLTFIDEGTTEVVLELLDGPDNPQPVHVHAGSCDELGDVAYPLNDLEDGRSSTQLEASLDELTGGDFAINAHQSADEIETYTACGDVPQE